MSKTGNNPPTDTEKYPVSVTVPFDKDLFEWLTFAADFQGCTVAEVVSKAVEQARNRIEKKTPPQLTSFMYQLVMDNFPAWKVHELVESSIKHAPDLKRLGPFDAIYDFAKQLAERLFSV